MRIEETSGALRAAADLITRVSVALDGHGPELIGAWYKLFHHDGSGYAWVRYIGDRATKYPAQSLHVVVFPHLEFREDDRLAVGRDWWGKEDRHIVAVGGDSGRLAIAVEVIAKAFWIDCGRPR